MNTQGYKKAFCLVVHASTNVAAKGPLLLKLEQMDFYELQTEEILTCSFMSDNSKHSWGGHRSPDSADDLHSWQYGTI